jgi:hypothetical protein
MNLCENTNKQPQSRYFLLIGEHMKLGIYKQAVIRQRPSAGCGRSFDNDCGASARGG